MPTIIATVEYTSLFIGAGLTAGIGVIAWLIATAFTAGEKSGDLKAYGKDIEAINKRLDTMQASINSAHSKAQNANATAEAAHALVKETVSRLGGMQNDITNTFKDMLGRVDEVKDEILLIYKDKGKK